MRLSATIYLQSRCAIKTHAAAIRRKQLDHTKGLFEKGSLPSSFPSPPAPPTHTLTLQINSVSFLENGEGCTRKMEKEDGASRDLIGQNLVQGPETQKAELKRQQQAPKPVRQPPTWRNQIPSYMYCVTAS